MKLVIRVAATSANLGPGFDVLGLALSLYNTFEIDTTRRGLTVSGLYDDDMTSRRKNLFWRTFRQGLAAFGAEAPSLGVHLHADVPTQSGLGSSATAVVGGLVAAAAFAPQPIGDEHILAAAAAIEGHADNVAAAVYGGFTISMPGGTPSVAHLPPPPGLTAVVVHPGTRNRTSTSRKALPRRFARADAIHNLGRTAILALALAGQMPPSMLQSAMQDALHQPQRIGEGSLQDHAIQLALRHGAYGAALSGSGPSILALVAADRSAHLARALRESLPGCSVWDLVVPERGYVIERSAP